MIFATRWPARLVTIAVLTLSLNAGCRERDGTSIVPADFQAHTKGKPVELWFYIGQLHDKYGTAVPTSPTASRELLLAFTSAVISTANAIIADPSSSPSQREEALRLVFATYKKRESVDPKSEAKLLEMVDMIEGRHPNTEAATRAAEERARILGERIRFATDENRHDCYDAAVNAVLHVAFLDPPPSREKSAKILTDLAAECERWRFYDICQKVDAVVAEKFSDFPQAAFAKGALHRYGLKGKVIDDLEAKGRNGKLISIKDYRGKVVLVVFWVSFLEPFVDEMVEIEKFRQQYDPKDFEVIGVCLDPDSDSAMELMDTKKIPWPQMFSKITDAEMNSEMSNRYGFKSAAFRMIVDREGKLVDYGPLFAQMKPELEKLLPPPVAKSLQPAAKNAEPAAEPKSKPKD